MPFQPAFLTDLRDAPFDTIIDVRSPAEFAEDHVPGAINLPALSNAERAEIGTIYKQVSPFDARKKGAALVARNVATHLETALADRDGSWQPLVYCWRGGQRSGSFASILQQIGWRAEVLDGGYRSYRLLVQKALYEQPFPWRLILLDGYTGTAKTALLALLRERGVQVVDLEGLAHHRGSLLGRTDRPQPTQRGFETAVMAAFAACDPARPVVVEAESSKIGRLNLPPKLWEAMAMAPRIVIEAPLAARAAFLVSAYRDVSADMADLKTRLAPLRRLRGHRIVDKWEGMLAAGDLTGFAAAIMQEHYDPAYARSRGRSERPVLGRVRADRLDAQGRSTVAERIVQLLGSAQDEAFLGVGDVTDPGGPGVAGPP